MIQKSYDGVHQRHKTAISEEKEKGKNPTFVAKTQQDRLL